MATVAAVSLAKTSIVIVPESHLIRKRYLGTTDLANVMYVAACLKTDLILITNDCHFNRIRDEGIIKVRSIAEAVKQLLGR